MKLYNVTFDLDDTRKILVPTIPKSAASNENKTIPRVCLTDSIEHCIQAIAPYNRDIRVGAKIIVREIDIDHLDQDKLITPYDLYKQEWVPDALENEEYWYLGTIEFYTTVHEITDFHASHALALSCIKIEDCEKIINKYVPEFDTSQYGSTRELYETAMKYCCKMEDSGHYEYFEYEDNIWDDLESLPWSRKIEIEDIQLKDVDLSLLETENEMEL